MARCEDWPCCGHTPQDPCERQPYDEPGYYDTSVRGQEHRLCDHENGECDVDIDDEDQQIEDLARELCDTYYLTVDPANKMSDAFSKITEKTREHWRAQASLMIERGWSHD